MPISISILNDRQIALVTYEPGTVSKQDLTRQRKQVGDTLMQNKIKKVLVDTSKLDKLPSPGILLLHNRSLVDEETLHNARFAVVCARLGANENFLETSGVNRGLQIKCFTSREEALSWLE
jgi:hypothetical protein